MTVDASFAITAILAYVLYVAGARRLFAGFRRP